ncbi:MAG TPA: transglycosylase SLT domain-containing protein [Gemmatimonadales bacterium]
MAIATAGMLGLRLCGLTAAGLSSVLLVSASARPISEGATPAVVADRTSIPIRIQDSIPLYVWQATPADSLRAEVQLPPAAVRRSLEHYLGRYSADRALVHRISRAVVRESRRQRVPASLIAAVLVTENTTLTPEATSSVGALGLMQVMPMHAGAQLCASDDLTDVDSNICHGTLILARTLRRTTTPTAALLRYNGCVRGTNTPDCHWYPVRVLARAHRVRYEILSAAGTQVVPNGRGTPTQLAAR